MIFFNNDYNQGAHPRILERLTSTNFEQSPGYGEDDYCKQASDMILERCGDPDGQVHFLTGGTQANLTVISAALRPHQGVISADSGHINVHETGSIEATGHKVLALPGGLEGKISANQVEKLCIEHIEDSSFEHMVQPKMVYISHPTENGMLYSFAELKALRKTCDRFGLYLFLDGARLAYGLAARSSTLSLKDISSLCDVFYIGGTKCGALFGEAVVINHPDIQKDFRYMIKQKGGMLAKGRLLGLQFSALFEDGLYTEIASQADEYALKIAEACKSSGYKMLVDSPTNQQFPILPNQKLEKLSEKYVFAVWQKMDNEHTAIRLCTSWATTKETVDELIDYIRSL